MQGPFSTRRAPVSVSSTDTYSSEKTLRLYKENRRNCLLWKKVRVHNTRQQSEFPWCNMCLSLRKVQSPTTTIQCFQESVLLRRTPERTSLHILAESQQNSLKYALERSSLNRPKYFYSLGVAPFLPLSALESKPKGHVAPSSRLSACPAKGNHKKKPLRRRTCHDYWNCSISHAR